MYENEYGFWYDSRRHMPCGMRLELFHEHGAHKTCGAGDTVEWRVVTEKGQVIDSGFTCPCCRGCGNKDDIDDVAAWYLEGGYKE